MATVVWTVLAFLAVTASGDAPESQNGSDCLCGQNLPGLQTQDRNSPLGLQYSRTLIRSAGHQPNRYGGATTRTERLVVFELR